MTDEARLKRIEKRVRALGWDWICLPGYFQIRLKGTGKTATLYMVGDPDETDDLATAERLLSLYEEGPERVEACVNACAGIPTDVLQTCDGVQPNYNVPCEISPEPEPKVPWYRHIFQLGDLDK